MKSGRISYEALWCNSFERVSKHFVQDGCYLQGHFLLEHGKPTKILAGKAAKTWTRYAHKPRALLLHHSLRTQNNTLPCVIYYSEGSVPAAAKNESFSRRPASRVLVKVSVFLFGLWGYWLCGHSWPIVPASGDSEDVCGEADGM
jgi:hypothetical protein